VGWVASAWAGNERTPRTKDERRGAGEVGRGEGGTSSWARWEEAPVKMGRVAGGRGPGGRCFFHHRPGEEEAVKVSGWGEYSKFCSCPGGYTSFRDN
jgi:hypothetical protein